jgi:hypothetical protein
MLVSIIVKHLISNVLFFILNLNILNIFITKKYYLYNNIPLIVIYYSKIKFTFNNLPKKILKRWSMLTYFLTTVRNFFENNITTVNISNYF